jgi:hypothetical protein
MISSFVVAIVSLMNASILAQNDMSAFQICCKGFPAMLARTSLGWKYQLLITVAISVSVMWCQRWRGSSLAGDALATQKRPQLGPGL